MSTQKYIIQRTAFFACFFILLGVIVSTQYLGHAYLTELRSDANGHYVTTLMAYDYIKAGFPGNPVAFAVDYFIHYPSIRIGNNPPFFYGLSSLWALITTDTIEAALFLTAILGAIYCLIVFYWSAQLLGRWAGAFIAFIVAVLPTFQAVTGSFLIDIPIGIFSLAAALCYRDFLTNKSASAAIWFSFAAAAALMIKLSALFLAVMVLLTIIISGKFALLKHRYFWLPALLIGVLIMPWYIVTFDSVTEGAKTQWTILYPLKALTGYLLILKDNLTLPGFIALLVGLFDRIRFIRSGQNEKISDHWTIVIALFIAVIFFQILIPANILERYLTAALGPAVILSWQGALVSGRYISEAFGRRQILPERLRNKFPEMTVAALLVMILASSFPVEPQTGNQMAQTAQKAYPALLPNNPSVLIASDGARESSFIAQMAQLDQARPTAITIRGARLLGKEEGFMNVDYMPKFASPEEVLAELERLSIAMVVLDRSEKAQEWLHNRHIAWLIDNRPDLWIKISPSDNPAGDGDISIYILKSSGQKNVDMPLLTETFRPNSGGFGKK